MSATRSTKKRRRRPKKTLPPNPLPFVRKQARWTTDEERILQKHYGRRGAQYCALLLGRTRSAVNHRAKRLHLYWEGTARWRIAEIRYLQKRFKQRTYLEIARTLRRPVRNVRQKARIMGWSKYTIHKWSREEDETLRALYGRVPNAQIAIRLHRTIASLTARAKLLKLLRPIKKIRLRDVRFIVKNVEQMPYAHIAKRMGVSVARLKGILAHQGKHLPPRTYRWTPEADAFIRERLLTMPYSAIAKQLGKTRRSVEKRARRLGIVKKNEFRYIPHRWMPEDEALLRQLYQRMQNAEIAKQLERSRPSIQKRARQLGLTKRGPTGSYYWTREENTLLRRLHGTLPMTEIAKKIGRSKGAVVMHAHSIGIPKRRLLRWTPEEDERLRRLHGTMSVAALGKHFGRQGGSVWKRAEHMGLVKSKNAGSGAYHRWTPEEDKQLRTLLKSMSYMVVAQQLGKTWRSVEKRARRLGIPQMRAQATLGKAAVKSHEGILYDDGEPEKKKP